MFSLDAYEHGCEERCRRYLYADFTEQGIIKGCKKGDPTFLRVSKLIWLDPEPEEGANAWQASSKAFLDMKPASSDRFSDMLPLLFDRHQNRWCQCINHGKE